ncbi:PTS enzyme IID, mannose-specific [Klebsiella pneumoniae]|uniref:PTS enzyme IID, mannose-specific n=1 Tax=Klebsiella pneumoniae TaxID=573 RepID=A0A447RWT3_KLEPN|nr:PTS enzyme IID, mannose-specific [Klebsiella pneumoniae]
MFLRSNLQQASFNFERIHGLGFCYDMIPAIKRLYPLKADQVAALKRHLVFFNTTPAVCGPVIGVTAAMEEARANGAAIDDGAINGIKVGLMGPLAGVGDPLVWARCGRLPRPWRLAGPLRQHSGTFVIFLYFQCSAAGNEVVRPATGLP